MQTRQLMKGLLEDHLQLQIGHFLRDLDPMLVHTDRLLRYKVVEVQHCLKTFSKCLIPRTKSVDACQIVIKCAAIIK